MNLTDNSTKSLMKKRRDSADKLAIRNAITATGSWKKSRALGYLIYILILINIVIVLALLYKINFRHDHGINQQNRQIVKQVPSREAPLLALAPIIAAPIASNAAPKTEAKLQNISLEQVDSKSILELLLSEKTSYGSELISEQQLMITLDNVSLPGNFPVVLDKTFIASMEVGQRENHVQITLLLLPGTTIETLEIVDKNRPSPILRLVLTNRQLSNVIMSKIAAPKSREEIASEQYQEIEKLLADSKNKEAIYKLYIFLGDFPSHIEARTTLASLLINGGQWQKASEVLVIGLKKHPGSLPLIKLQARALIHRNKLNEAIELLLSQIGKAIHDAEYLSLLAFLYQKTGNFAAAVELYQQLTRLEPQKTAWWLGLGIALEKMGHKNSAKNAYLRGYHGTNVPQGLQQLLLDKVK
jgi:Flp pilus assembly protein TadD